nr:unnamed protein product [Digitaria exilis]
MAAVWESSAKGSPKSAAPPPPLRRVLAVSTSDDGKVPRGYVPMVLVGDEEVGYSEEERVMVRVEMLKEPCMAEVLEMAAQQFGYGQRGVLRIPCGVDRFQQMIGGVACEAS